MRRGPRLSESCRIGRNRAETVEIEALTLSAPLKLLQDSIALTNTQLQPPTRPPPPPRASPAPPPRSSRPPSAAPSSAAEGSEMEMTWPDLQAEQQEVGPRKAPDGKLADLNQLLHNHRKNVRTMPRNRKNADGSVRKGVRELMEADTAEKRSVLKRARMREIVTSLTDETQRNSWSRFGVYKHYLLEEGKHPIRWQCVAGSSTEVLAQ